MEKKIKSSKAVRTRKRMKKELTTELGHRAILHLTEEKPIQVLHVDDERALLKVARAPSYAPTFSLKKFMQDWY